MRFINRFEELKELEKFAKLSKRGLFSSVIYGQRRIGKTELVTHFNKKIGIKHLYFFVYEGKTAKSLLTEFTNELKNKKILEKEVHLKTLDEFIEVLFKKCQGYIIVFDEVQYLKKIYPPFFSVLQRKFDENKNAKIFFVFLGSIIGLIKKVFEDTKAPLYGRIHAKINLKPLTYVNTRKLLKELKYHKEEDFIKFYTLFGGIPKYYVAIEDYNLSGKSIERIIQYFFLGANALFKDEVLSILRQEFGTGKGNYYTILEAIATGHTKLSEIASYCGLDQTSITPFIRDLTEYYELISRVSKVTEKRGKWGYYTINNPLFRFWFKFIHKNIGLYEIGEYESLFKEIKSELNSLFGRAFEEVSKEALICINQQKRLPISFQQLGRWWGAYRENDQRKTAEIDILALNKKTKQILFAECKWKSNANAKKILSKLREKSKYVDWNNEKRKEYFAIFAKSFKNRKKFEKEMKKRKEKNVFLFDLKDIKKILRRY